MNSRKPGRALALGAATRRPHGPHRPLAALLGLLTLVGAGREAGAQSTVGGIALNTLEPAPAGDAFFAVQSPFVGGHLVPRAYLMFDYAKDPLTVLAPQSASVVSQQSFLRVDASLAVVDRLLFSIDIPFAVAQSGEDPGVAGVDFHPPSSAEVSDIRLGGRVRIVGEGAFGLAAGAYVFVPSGPSGSYAGEGAVRLQPHLVIGGRVGKRVGVAYSASLGTHVKTSDNPSTFNFGAGVAGVFADGLLQVGPEIFGAAPLGGDPALSTPSVTVSTASDFNLELAFGAKLRFAKGVVVGAAGGPGLSQAIGTPSFRAMLSVGWAPEGDPAKADAKKARDRDDDGFNDDVDACPDVPGDLQGDPKKDGCPKADRDKDGVADVDDACPTVPGIFSPEAAQNGCPQDKDGDGISDVDDECPTAKGPKSNDPKRNGCPEDRDGDGIGDALDACPNSRGPDNADPKRNGCPDDPDGDGLKFAADACPLERGAATNDPATSGCPKWVRVTDTEIVLLKPIKFRTDGRTRRDTIDPVSDEVLAEVRDVIQQHPEIESLEVQGHTDDEGNDAYNARLSIERANNVKDWLVKAGVPEGVLVTKGYGSTVPVGDNRIRAGRLKNRRVQFVILKKK